MKQPFRSKPAQPKNAYSLPNPKNLKKAISGVLGSPAGFVGGPYGWLMGAMFGGRKSSFRDKVKMFINKGMS